MLNKKSISLIVCCAFSVNSYSVRAADAPSPNPRFEQLKATIFLDSYEELPRYKVTRKLFKETEKGQPSRLYNDAKRTLSESTDLLPENRGQKLLQANGICFTGNWIIDQKSKFTGLFKQGSNVPIISRISVSFSGTRQKERRALGIAVKLLPNNLGNAPSMNIFALHSVGGVQTDNVLDLTMDNEPSLGRIPVFGDILTALKLKNELLKADKEVGSKKPSVTYRTISPLAEYQADQVISPRWIRFSPITTYRVNKDDFRDELQVANYPDQTISYKIEVGTASNANSKKSKASWQLLGKLVLNQSVTSKACDTRLHFPHPKN